MLLSSLKYRMKALHMKDIGEKSDTNTTNGLDKEIETKSFDSSSQITPKNLVKASNPMYFTESDQLQPICSENPETPLSHIGNINYTSCNNLSSGIPNKQASNGNASNIFTQRASNTIYNNHQLPISLFLESQESEGPIYLIKVDGIGINVKESDLCKAFGLSGGLEPSKIKIEGDESRFAIIQYSNEDFTIKAVNKIYHIKNKESKTPIENNNSDRSLKTINSPDIVTYVNNNSNDSILTSPPSHLPSPSPPPHPAAPSLPHEELHESDYTSTLTREDDDYTPTTFVNLKKIKINGIDESLTEKALSDLFSLTGNFLSCKIINEGDKRYVLVEYSSEESAIKAIKKFNGMKMKGSKVTVDYYKESPLVKNKIILENLPYNIEEERIRNICAVIGEIESLEIIRPENKNSRSKCFLTFKDEESIEKAKLVLEDSVIDELKTALILLYEII